MLVTKMMPAGEGSLACAVTRFVTQTLPSMDTSFTARDLWSKGLALSYRSELSTEEPERAAQRLFDADPGYYQALTDLSLEASRFNVKVSDQAGSPCSPGRCICAIPPFKRVCLAPVSPGQNPLGTKAFERTVYF